MRPVLLVPLVIAAVPASAQMAMPAAVGSRACPATPAVLPPEYAGWAAMTPVKAAASARELSLATLRLGESAKATLAPAGTVSFTRTPEQQPAPGSFGGQFAFAVTNAGGYRVALGDSAWIDVVREGRSIRSMAHGHGPDCSSIRKHVDFALQPGRYTLQVSGVPATSLALMVSKLP